MHQGTTDLRVVAECVRTPDSDSSVSDQPSLGLSPCHDTCVLEQDT